MGCIFFTVEREFVALEKINDNPCWRGFENRVLPRKGKKICFFKVRHRSQTIASEGCCFGKTNLKNKLARQATHRLHICFWLLLLSAKRF
jgi:hypothetical protein